MHIITNSKNHIKITDTQYTNLIGAMNDPSKRGVEINNKYVSFGDIAIILSDEDYNEKYPQAKPKPFWQEDINKSLGEKPYIIKTLENEMSMMYTLNFASLYPTIADIAIRKPREYVLSKLETKKGVICDAEIDKVKYPFSYTAFSLAYKALSVYRNA